MYLVEAGGPLNSGTEDGGQVASGQERLVDDLLQEVVLSPDNLGVANPNLETESEGAALSVEGGDGNVAGRTGCVVADLIARTVVISGRTINLQDQPQGNRLTARSRGNSGTAGSNKTTSAW